MAKNNKFCYSKPSVEGYGTIFGVTEWYKITPRNISFCKRKAMKDIASVTLNSHTRVLSIPHAR